jgi:hypothetical protein
VIGKAHAASGWQRPRHTRREGSTNSIRSAAMPFLWQILLHFPRRTYAAGLKSEVPAATSAITSTPLVADGRQAAQISARSVGYPHPGQIGSLPPSPVLMSIMESFRCRGVYPLRMSFTPFLAN